MSSRQLPDRQDVGRSGRWCETSCSPGPGDCVGPLGLLPSGRKAAVERLQHQNPSDTKHAPSRTGSECGWKRGDSTAQQLLSRPLPHRLREVPLRGPPQTLDSTWPSHGRVPAKPAYTVAGTAITRTCLWYGVAVSGSRCRESVRKFTTGPFASGHRPRRDGRVDLRGCRGLAPAVRAQVLASCFFLKVILFI